MGHVLFQRVVRITVGTAAFTTTGTSSGGITQTAPAFQTTGLRVKAKIKRSLRFEPNTADIQIYNCNEEHRSQMKGRWIPIVLEAGYGDHLGRIFSGEARFIDHVKEGADWISKCQCGDGERAFRFTRLSKGYGTGTGVLQVAKDLVAALGSAAAGTSTNLAANLTDQFAGGYAVHGQAGRELTKILSGRGLEWSIQDGKIQVLPIGKPNGGTAILLSPTTGLVGSPEHGTPSPQQPQSSQHTLTLKCFLQPTIIPGVAIQLSSRSAKGLMRAATVSIDLDTHGGPFYDEIEANPV